MIIIIIQIIFVLLLEIKKKYFISLNFASFEKLDKNKRFSIYVIKIP